MKGRKRKIKNLSPSSWYRYYFRVPNHEDQTSQDIFFLIIIEKFWSAQHSDTLDLHCGNKYNSIKILHQCLRVKNNGLRLPSWRKEKDFPTVHSYKLEKLVKRMTVRGKLVCKWLWNDTNASLVRQWRKSTDFKNIAFETNLLTRIARRQGYGGVGEDFSSYYRMIVKT